MIHVCFPRCVVRAMFDTSPTSRANLRSVDLFRDLLQVVNVIVTTSLRFLSRTLRVRSLVLMHAHD